MSQPKAILILCEKVVGPFGTIHLRGRQRYSHRSLAGPLSAAFKRRQPTGPWLQDISLSLRLGMPFDQDHVCPGGAVAHLARFAVFFAVEPFLGALR
jgi:hypothetical protein